MVTRLPLTATWPWRTSWRAWARLDAPPGAEGDVVEAQLEHLEQVLAGDARAAVGLVVDAAELLLHEAVDAAGLLLLAELQQVLGALPLAAGVPASPGG